MSNPMSLSKREIEIMPKLLKLAIKEYTHHVEINRLLRKRVVSISPSKRPGPQQKMLRRLDLAFALVTPLSQPITVYRGIKETGPFSDDLGFTSTAVKPLTAGQLASFAGTSCCMLVIHVPAGASVVRIPGSIGFFGDENELLLFRGGKFVPSASPTGIVPNPGIQTFELDYIQAPIPPQNSTLMAEMRRYMTANGQLINSLLRKDANIDGLISKYGPKLLFRCLVGNLMFNSDGIGGTVYDGLKKYSSALLDNRATRREILSQINGLISYITTAFGKAACNFSTLEWKPNK